MNITDFMKGHSKATIYNYFKPEQAVRTLTVEPSGDVTIAAGDGESITLPGDTVITYEAWMMDRGSLLFVAPSGKYIGKQLKLCTELDPVEFEDMSVVRATHPEGVLTNLA